MKKDANKAILVFSLSQNDFDLPFNQFIYYRGDKDLNFVSKTYYSKPVNMLFFLTPSPRKNELTIQSDISIKKRGKVKLNFYDYFFLKFRRVYRTKKYKKTLNCKEKNIHFLKIHHDTMDLSAYDKFEVFFPPDQLLSSVNFFSQIIKS